MSLPPVTSQVAPAASPVAAAASPVASSSSRAGSFCTQIKTFFGRKISELSTMDSKVHLAIEMTVHATVTVSAVVLAVMAGSTFAIFSTLVGAIAMGVLIYKNESEDVPHSRKGTIIHCLDATQNNTKNIATICFAALTMALVPSFGIRLVAFGILALRANDIASRLA